MDNEPVDFDADGDQPDEFIDRDDEEIDPADLALLFFLDEGLDPRWVDGVLTVQCRANPQHRAVVDLDRDEIFCSACENTTPNHGPRTVDDDPSGMGDTPIKLTKQGRFNPLPAHFAERNDVSAAEKILMAVIAGSLDDFNDARKGATAAFELLAARCGMSTTYVQRLVNNAVAGGRLIVRKVKYEGRWTNNYIPICLFNDAGTDLRGAACHAEDEVPPSHTCGEDTPTRVGGTFQHVWEHSDSFRSSQRTSKRDAEGRAQPAPVPDGKDPADAVADQALACGTNDALMQASREELVDTIRHHLEQGVAEDELVEALTHSELYKVTVSAVAFILRSHVRPKRKKKAKRQSQDDHRAAAETTQVEEDTPPPHDYTVPVRDLPEQWRVLRDDPNTDKEVRDLLRALTLLLEYHGYPELEWPAADEAEGLTAVGIDLLRQAMPDDEDLDRDLAKRAADTSDFWTLFGVWDEQQLRGFWRGDARRAEWTDLTPELAAAAKRSVTAFKTETLSNGTTIPIYEVGWRERRRAAWDAA